MAVVINGTTGITTPDLTSSDITVTDIIDASGVYLGGTGSANKLDDYEEGTWTVQMYDASSGGNASSTSVTGKYTKIGQQVIASFDAFNNVNTTGLTTGNTVYFTLPFASSSSGRSIGSCQTDNVTYPSGTTMVNATVSNSSSRATLNCSGSNTQDVAIKEDAFNGTTSDIVNWTLSYRTDA